MGKSPKKPQKAPKSPQYLCVLGAELAEKAMISNAYVFLVAGCVPCGGMQLKNTCVRLFRWHHETKR
jgi:hypothetical protein